MSVARTVRERLNGMSPRERRVAQALFAKYPTAGLETVAQLAKTANVSGATVLRFVTKIGFTGYPEFQKALREEIELSRQSPASQYEYHQYYIDSNSYVDRFFEAASRNLNELFRNINKSEFNITTNLISDPQRPLFIIGGRFSHFLAAYVGWHLQQVRPRVHVVGGQSESWAGALVDVGRRSVVLTFDFRRYQTNVMNFSLEAAKRGADIILITDNWLSPIAADARSVWCCPIEVSSPYDSLLTAVALSECLIGSVVQHGGDPVRARIQRIEELASTIPIVQPLTES